MDASLITDLQTQHQDLNTFLKTHCVKKVIVKVAGLSRAENIFHFSQHFVNKSENK